MPWFKIDRDPGLRDLKEQMHGLDALKQFSARASVLDLGCAEGLIGKFMIDVWGADHVDGIEVVPARVEKARELCEGYENARFFCSNFDDPSTLPEDLLPRYDVVLALAIAHKLRDPVAFIEWAAEHANVLAIRLPTKHPIFRNKRSGMVEINPQEILSDWNLIWKGRGPRTEWTGIWRRP